MKSALKPASDALRRHPVARVALLLSIFFATLVFFAFNYAYDFLCLDTGPRQGEAIVVLGGESIGRMQQALELYRAGAAPLVIVSGDGVENQIQKGLLRGGVPAEAIELEPKSRNTKENAEFTVRLFERHKVRRAIIVTSWFHSRRAMNCFRTFAPNTRFSSVPCSSFNGFGADCIHVALEYVKTVWYVFRYGISPWLPSTLSPWRVSTP